MQRHHSKQNIWTKLSILTVAYMFFLLNSTSLFAGDYLDELASEAEATASVSKRIQLTPSEKKELKQMEAILKEKKPSTYKYYVKLNTKNKEYAYEKWASDTSKTDDRLHHLQKKVMDLYFTQ